MAQMRVDAYEVLYSANGFAPRIALKNAGNYIGQMIFLPNGAALPADTVVLPPVALTTPPVWLIAVFVLVSPSVPEAVTL